MQCSDLSETEPDSRITPETFYTILFQDFNGAQTMPQTLTAQRTADALPTPQPLASAKFDGDIDNVVANAPRSRPNDPNNLLRREPSHSNQASGIIRGQLQDEIRRPV